MTEPTLALIGEAGPEVVMPLSSMQVRSGEQHNVIYVNVSIGNVTAEVPMEDVKDAVLNGVAEGVWRRN